MSLKHVAVVGAGWAGLAAAVAAIRQGHKATVFEASHTLGGRARAINAKLPNGISAVLDNGQHILIGAYSETLRMLQTVGVDAELALLRLPLALVFPDGGGLQLPRWPAPLDAAWGILSARGWSLTDKASLIKTALRWQSDSFVCASTDSVADLCIGVSPRVMRELIAPLCVSALNTPAERASGQVFLRVLGDSLFGGAGSSNLLLPRVDLGRLFPEAAARWIEAHGGQVQLGQRIGQIQPDPARTAWHIGEQAFDAVILANSLPNITKVLSNIELLATQSVATDIRNWVRLAGALRFEAITTVYAWAQGATLQAPMLALRHDHPGDDGQMGLAPAQFVFDRGQLGGPAGLLAFVVSASHLDRSSLQAQVLQQAKDQLGLTLHPVQTVVEKRATFACTPGLRRPPIHIAPGLLACGDYCDGPYPATLEGAVRSGIEAAVALGDSANNTQS